MSVTDTLVYEKVVQEIISTAMQVHYEVDYVLEAGGVNLRPYRLLHLDTRRDFQNGFGDEIMVGLAISSGDYYRYAEPFKQDLYFSLTLTPIGETGNQPQLSYPVRKYRYKAVSRIIQDRDLQGLPSYSDDQTMINIELQLVPMALWELRVTTVGGIFHRERTVDVLRALVGHYSRQLSLSGDDAIIGTEFIEPSNQNPRDNIIIRHGVYLLDLPGYLQKHCGGIYNQGIGMYLHDRVWFIYPLYDNTLYDKAEYPLDVFIVPPNRYPGNTRSFQIKDERLQILSGSSVNQVDPSDLLYLTRGNGTRFTQATKFFEEYATVKGTEVVTNSDERLAQFTFRTRKGDVQHAPFSAETITDNIAYQMSKIATRVGQTINVKWDNARPDLLRPGMACKVFFGTEEGYRELRGQLLAVDATTHPASKGITDNRYVTNCLLTLFVENDE